LTWLRINIKLSNCAFAVFLAKKGNDMGKMDSSKGIPLRTGGVMPKGADAADTKGERHEPLKGGVAMGMEDAVGSDKLFNTGRTAGVCYEHKRTAYAKEDAGQK
jgi:hypothetical protein